MRFALVRRGQHVRVWVAGTSPSLMLWVCTRGRGTSYYNIKWDVKYIISDTRTRDIPIGTYVYIITITIG